MYYLLRWWGRGIGGDIEKKKKRIRVEIVRVYNEDFCMIGEMFVNKWYIGF